MSGGMDRDPSTRDPSTRITYTILCKVCNQIHTIEYIAALDEACLYNSVCYGCSANRCFHCQGGVNDHTYDDPPGKCLFDATTFLSYRAAWGL